ncbi:unnamed protein product [Meganyctiphanes norvegica]|uniref:Uncharacterized protein n=1 Tax=Meganyctiphanes norvegica TaxID=48144 RepID=A0AAV2PXJ9_MEGNR
MNRLWSSLLVAVVLSCLCHVATGNMEDTIRDLYDGPDESEGRFFLNYDQAAAFNTSVAFTIPLFSFTLPGASSTTTGLDKQSFGAMAFVALFLLGGLGVAIYTTTGTGAGGRSMDDEDQSLLTSLITNSLGGLPNVIDTDSCAKLAVCGAYQDSSKYGLFALPLKFLVPNAEEVPSSERSGYQHAAMYGLQEDADDCYYEYPCLVQPLDVMLYMYDALFARE